MKNYQTFLSLCIFVLLASCSKFGSGRVATLVELTPKLEVEQAASVKLFAHTQSKKIEDFDPKASSYIFNSTKIVGKPTIAKNVVYSLNKHNYLTAFSLKEHKILWNKNLNRYQQKHASSRGGILYNNGKLYVTNGSKDLIVINAKNGEEIVRKSFPNILSHKPILANGQVVVVQTINNQVIAYDLKRANFLWSQEGGLEIITTKNQAAPILYNNHVLATYSSGQIVYININTGQLKWFYQLNDSPELVSLPSFEPLVATIEPIIHNNYAYITTSNNYLLKLDLDNGKAVWKKPIADILSMQLYNDELVITTNARQAAILGTEYGQVKWVGELRSEREQKNKDNSSIILQPAIVKDNHLNITASNGQIYQFTYEDGKLATTPTTITCLRNVSYQWVSCCNGKLHLFNQRAIQYVPTEALAHSKQ